MAPPSRESFKQTPSTNLKSSREKTPGVDTKVVPHVPSGAISQNSMEFKTSASSKVLGDVDDTESNTEREKMKLAVQDKMADVKAAVSALPLLPIKYEGTKHKVELMKLRRRPYENGVTNPRKRFGGVEKVVDDNKAIKRYKAILNSLSKSLAQCDKYINRLLQLEDGGEQDGKDEKIRESADDDDDCVDDCVIVESPSVKRQKIGKHEAVKKSSKTLLDTSLDSTKSRQPLSSSKTAESVEDRISRLHKEHDRKAAEDKKKLRMEIEKVIKKEEALKKKKEEALKKKKEEEEAIKKNKQAKDQALTETSVINSLTPTIKQELADVVSSTLLILAIRIPSDVVLSAMQELFVYTWDELSAQSILNTELSAAFRSILLTGLRARPLLLDYMNTALYMDAAFYAYSQSSTPIPLDALIVHALNKM